jgi:hypothetical protein
MAFIEYIFSGSKLIRSFFLFQLFFISIFSFGQFETSGARSAALGGSSITQQDVFSAQNNQAGLGFIKSVGVGAYFENRYLLKQLNHSSFLATIPIKKGTFGISYNGFGYSQFKQDKFGIAYGILLSENFSVGVQLNYHSIRIGDIYGRADALTAALGFQGKISKQITFAAHIHNLNRTKLADYNNERMPSVIKLGIQYSYSEKLNIQLEADKNSNEKLNFKGGVEYMPAQDFYLRFGVTSNPNLFSFGTGFKINTIKIDISSSYHPVLGFSPQVALHSSFGKVKSEKEIPNEQQ